MHTETLHLPIRQLRAAIQFAPKPKDDIRYYLCGVLLERRSGFVKLVSTDGWTLFTCRAEGEHPGDDLEVILPRSLIEQIKRPGKNGPDLAAVTLSREVNETGGHGPWRIRIEAGDLVAEEVEIEGQYPNWRRVIPDAVSGAHAQFDVRLLARFEAASRELFGKGEHVPLHVYPNGDNPGLVRFLNDRQDSILGVVMPFGSPASEDVGLWVRFAKA